MTWPCCVALLAKTAFKWRMRSDCTEWHGDKFIKNTTTKEIRVFSFRDSTLSSSMSIGSLLRRINVLAKAALSRMNAATSGLNCQRGDGRWRCLASWGGGRRRRCNGEVICAIICVIHTRTHICVQAWLLMCVHKCILMYEVCKNQKKKLYSESLCTHRLFVFSSFFLEPPWARTHAHAHARALYLSILPVHHSSPPHSITCLTEGLPGKMAAFQTAHSAQRDNALIGEVCRPRAQQKFRHASNGFSICIPDAILFFASFCRILRLQTKCTSGKHLLALKLVFHPRFRLFFLCCSPCSTLCSP